MAGDPTSARRAAELASLLQPGDLLFTALRNPMARHIANASGSWISHVGIAFAADDGSWRVAESAVPWSRWSTLERHLRRSEGATVSVKRVISGISGADAGLLQASASTRLRRWYHTGFDYYGSRQFCSKFVYDVYREALGIEVGRLENFGALLARNPSATLAFWRFWYFGRIPWTRVTVTPVSQHQSPLLTTVYERFDLRGRRAAMPARQSTISSSQSAP
jgi:hypothetical protein